MATIFPISALYKVISTYTDLSFFVDLNTKCYNLKYLSNKRIYEQKQIKNNENHITVLYNSKKYY